MPSISGAQNRAQWVEREAMSKQTVIPEGVRRIFMEGFRVADIAEPLVSFDEFTPGSVILAAMNAADFDVVGIRRHGRAIGFVERQSLEGENCDKGLVEFDRASLLTDSASFSAAVSILSREPRLFVTAFGEVAAILTKDDMQKPPVRMWLFGMVTLVELRYGQLIEEMCPSESWRQYLSEGRLKKALDLLAERSRRNRSLDLLDCLQLSDKGQIIARNEEIRRLTIFESRNQAEEGIKLLEGLRNNLAHAQDIVSTDWDAIVRLSGHLDRVLNSTGENQHAP